MTSREGRQSARPTDSIPNHGPTPRSIDLGVFVERYHNLLELLFPLRLAGNAVLYVFRWQNYLLTLVVLIVLSVLVYHPSLFLSFLTLVTILLMAVGKYYSHTKALYLLRKRVRPNVELLDQDAQHFRTLHKEHKKTHKTLAEFKQIIYNIDNFMITASNVLDYFYKIVLWKSPEVSLCVTVLLCIGFVLLCTVCLSTIITCVPLVVLCINGYFLKRTVECLKNIGSFIYRMFRRKQKKAGSGDPTAAAPAAPATAQASTDVEGSESVDGTAGSQSSDGSHNATAGEAPATDLNNASDSEDPGRSRTDSTLSAGATASETLNAERLSQSGSKVEEFCTKCNSSFAKLLKRKHDCNYCGQSFCGSCTVKVKRALLGATSPAAFEESVRVCLDCNTKLNNLRRRRDITRTPSVLS